MYDSLSSSMFSWKSDNKHSGTKNMSVSPDGNLSGTLEF